MSDGRPDARASGVGVRSAPAVTNLVIGRPVAPGASWQIATTTDDPSASLAVWAATADDATFTARAFRCAGLRHRHLVSVAGVGDTPSGRVAWAPLPPGGPAPTRLPEALAAPLLAELTAALVFAAACDVEVAPPDPADLWLTEDSVVRFLGLLRPVPAGTTEADRCQALANIWAAWTGSPFEATLPTSLSAWAAALDARCAVPRDPPISVSPLAPPAPRGAGVPVTPVVAPDANARLASAPPSSLVGAPTASAPREVAGAVRPTPPAAGPPSADRPSSGARSSGASSSSGPASAPPTAASAPDPDPSATFFDEPGLSEDVAPLPVARLDEPELGSLRVSDDPEDDRPRAAPRPRWPLLVLVGVLALGVVAIAASSYAPSPPETNPPPAPAPAARAEPEPAETGVAVEPVDPAAPAAPAAPSATPAPEEPPPEAPRAAPPAAACVRVAQAPVVGGSGSARVAVEVCAESGAPVTLFHRPAGASQWSSVAMSLDGDRWSADVPLDDRHAAGVEYYVVAAGGNTAGTSLRPLVAVPGG